MKIMTKKEVQHQFAVLKKSLDITKEFWRLYNSGGVDRETMDHGDVKAIFHVALLNEADQYRPLDGCYQRTAKNLKHF